MHRLAVPLKWQIYGSYRTGLKYWAGVIPVVFLLAVETNNSFLSLLGSHSVCGSVRVILGAWKRSRESVKMFQRSSERNINSLWGGFGSEGSLTHYLPCSHHMSHGVGTKAWVIMSLGKGDDVTARQGLALSWRPEIPWGSASWSFWVQFPFFFQPLKTLTRNLFPPV